MSRHGSEGSDARNDELRARAEATIARRPPGLMAFALDVQAGTDVMHELQVHQIELAMQNDELRRSERELFASREAYRALYDRAPVGYLTLDSRGNSLAANPMAATLLGVEPSDLRGRPLQALLPRAAADELHRCLQRVFSGGGPQRCELERGGSTAAASTLQLDAALVGGPGDYQVCHASLTDVSERKHMLEELKVLNQDLERVVRDRTGALRTANGQLEEELHERRRLEERIVEARKMEAIGRLAGGVAHDFNNLLTVMRLDLTVLRREAYGAAAVSAEELSLAIDRAAALTAKLLAFARREVVRTPPIEVGRVVAELEGMLLRLLGPEVALEVRRPAREAWVAVDLPSLEQVVVNIVINARDAIAGAGRVEIESEPITLSAEHAAQLSGGQPGEYVQLTIGDDGGGMTADEMSRIFEPFYTTKGMDRGSGLGLATVYGIVVGAGGFFELDSAVGRGTRFSIYLPRVAAPAEPNAPPPRVEPSQRSSGGATVLVVDDDRALRRALCDLLVDGQFDVIDAGCGVDALEALAGRAGDIDLVVSDIVMPDMDGFQLAERVRALWPSVAVLLMSGYTAQETIPDGVRFLLKPFEPGELLAEVQAALESVGHQAPTVSG
jgi:PAS domain S-box-containing protein